ncbi:uncharacterized protein [Magallana gigas]|uniref:uncharacterized protein n=1 Tax=Magallana gigas TaxID=29159 RepID=UPI003340E0BD
MGLLFCAIFSLQTLIVSSLSQFEVVNKQTSWSSANSTCELAGFRLSGPVSPEQIPVDSALPEQSFWIGALSHHTPWFQVYTCKKVTEKNMTLKTDINVRGNDQALYDCFHACKNYVVFALSEVACYCGYKLVFQGYSCENRILPSSPYDLYGYSGSLAAGQVATLQYAQIQGESFGPYNGTGTGDCAAALIVPGSRLSSHQYLPCDTKLPYICSRNLSLVAVTWAEAVIRCNIVLTSSFEGYYETPTQSPTLAWTGISRRSHLYWGQDVLVNGNSLFHCLALSIGQNGTAVLTKKNCKEKLPYLCEKGTLITDSETSTNPSTITPETSSASSPEVHSSTTTGSTSTAESVWTLVTSDVTATQQLTSDVTATQQPTSGVTTTQQQSSTPSLTTEQQKETTSIDTGDETTNSTVTSSPYQSDSGFLLLLAAILAGVVILVVIIVLCLIYKRERTRHLFSSDKKKENADVIYSVVNRKKSHTKEIRDILDTLSDISYDVDISAQMTEKLPSEAFVNGSYDPAYDDLDPWYRSSLLIQVVPEGQTHTLTVSDLHPSPDKDTVDNFYNHVVRNVHGEI